MRFKGKVKLSYGLSYWFNHSDRFITFMVDSKLSILKDLSHQSTKKIGFRILTDSNSALKRRLKKLAPIHMSDPELNVGVVASYQGLLVYWCATFSNSKGCITCWCFRKAESNKSDPEEQWSQAIYVSGLNDDSKNKLAREARSSLSGFVDLTNSEDGILMVYDRPILKFSNTVNLLSAAIILLNKQ